ncbi:MAG: glycerol kinase GlpK [Planctomycetota bacterium]|nr:glycerol kinase GlpK [Planctomycetota bacterium]
MPYVVALDQGTTSSRAILFDRDGRVRASAQREFEQIFPQPGWVEHDARSIWTTQEAVLTEALHAAGATATDVAALGIANQRETTVVWDRKSGEPIYNAIVWQDRRTADVCAQLERDGHGESVQRKTGLLLDPYFSATKAAWILDHVDGARARAEAGELAFGTIDSWLVWKLTGGERHVTDASNASRTLLCDIHSGTWDDELLELFRIPRAVLPEIRSSSEIYGAVSATPAARDVPLAGIAGDQQAALFGQTCFRAGEAKNTYGTGCFLLLNTGTQAVTSRNRLITTVAWRLGDTLTYALEGSVFVGGAVVQWLRDGLGLVKHAAEIEALARSVEDNGGVYFVPAFAGLGAPHWDPHARGTLIGLTRGTTAGHVARAALEAVAYQVADVLDAMREDSGIRLKELHVDGGAAANNLLLQFQADLQRLPVVRPSVTETTALGAAYLAGLATGYWSGLDEISANGGVDRRFDPQLGAEQAAALRRRWSEAVSRSRGWAQAES